MKLQIDSTDQLIYENEILQLTVVGGIKLEGLDRMRSTLKVQLQQSRRPPVRHNLDLYNDTQLEKFIRKMCGAVGNRNINHIGQFRRTHGRTGKIQASRNQKPRRKPKTKI